MKMKLMRKIDWYAGLPLCYALAGLERLRRIFRGASDRPVRKILVVKFLGIGSIILAAPAIDALREKFPAAKIYFLTFSGNRAILELLGQADEAFFIRTGTPLAFALDTFKVMRQLRREKIDLFIDFEFFAKFPLVLASLINARRKAGFYLVLEPWRSGLLDYRGYYNHYYHVKDIFLSIVYLIAEDDPYYLRFKEYQEAYPLRKAPAQAKDSEVPKLLQSSEPNERSKVIVINPNAGEELATRVRRWPEEHFAELTRLMLSAHPESVIVYTGSAKERAYVESILRLLPRDSRIVNSAGQLSLPGLLALYGEADVFVTIDSGPSHLASLTDVPVVALFFAETPILYAPLTERKEIVSCDYYSVPLFTVYTGKETFISENKPAQTIKPNAVFEAAERLLRQKE